LFYFFVFRDRVSLFSPGCPGTHSVDQAGLELRNLPASASQVLGLKACATTPGSRRQFFFFFFCLFTLHPAHCPQLQVPPSHDPSSFSLPFFSELVRAPGYPPTLTHQVSVRICASSPTEAHQATQLGEQIPWTGNSFCDSPRSSVPVVQDPHEGQAAHLHYEQEGSIFLMYKS
jgi:hypothetical protein